MEYNAKLKYAKYHNQAPAKSVTYKQGYEIVKPDKIGQLKNNVNINKMTQELNQRHSLGQEQEQKKQQQNAMELAEKMREEKKREQEHSQEEEKKKNRGIRR